MMLLRELVLYAKGEDDITHGLVLCLECVLYGPACYLNCQPEALE